MLELSSAARREACYLPMFASEKSLEEMKSLMDTWTLVQPIVLYLPQEASY